MAVIVAVVTGDKPRATFWAQASGFRLQAKVKSRRRAIT